MSAHFSRYNLNTYCHSPYFRACLPAGYPTGAAMIAARRHRALPPNLRELSSLAKRYELRAHGEDAYKFMGDAYDDDGYELAIGTSRRLTRKEINDEWDALLTEDVDPPPDVPVPEGGFPDPDAWEPPAPEPDGPDPDAPTEADLIRDIQGYGRDRVASEYDIDDWSEDAFPTDADLARAIVAAREQASEATLSTDAGGREHRGKGEGGGQFAPKGGGGGAGILGGLLPQSGPIRVAADKFAEWKAELERRATEVIDAMPGGKAVQERAARLKERLKQRYGTRAMTAIVASGYAISWGAFGAGAALGVPVVVPSIAAMLPGLAVAELYHQMSKNRKQKDPNVAASVGDEGDDQHPEMSQEEIDRLAREFVDALSSPGEDEEE